MRRRDLLRSSGGLASVGATVALTGCSSDSGGDDGDDGGNGDDGGGGSSGSAPKNCVGGDERTEPPTVNFGIGYVEEQIPGTETDGHVEVTHERGDTIDACTLFFEGSSVSPGGGGRWDQQYVSAGGERSTPTSEETYAVAAGNSVYVPVDSDYELVLRWESADPTEGGSKRLGEWSGPDA